jgi:hypothetical protein
MSDRNQPSYNPNHYPHQVAYGQSGAYPNNGQQEYQQNQQPLYLPGSFASPYTYPMIQGQPEVYGMAPAFPMAQGNPQVCDTNKLHLIVSSIYLGLRDGWK